MRAIAPCNLATSLAYYLGKQISDRIQSFIEKSINQQSQKHSYRHTARSGKLCEDQRCPLDTCMSTLHKWCPNADMMVL